VATPTIDLAGMLSSIVNAFAAVIASVAEAFAANATLIGQVIALGAIIFGVTYVLLRTPIGRWLRRFLPL